MGEKILKLESLKHNEEYKSGKVINLISQVGFSFQVTYESYSCFSLRFKIKIFCIFMKNNRLIKLAAIQISKTIYFQDVKKTTNFLNFIPGYIIIPLKFCAIMYIMIHVIGKAVYIAFPVSFVSMMNKDFCRKLAPRPSTKTTKQTKSVEDQTATAG